MEMFVVVCGKEKNENFFFDDARALFCEIAIRILFVHIFFCGCLHFDCPSVEKNVWKRNKNKLSDDVCHEKLRNITELICKPEMRER